VVRWVAVLLVLGCRVGHVATPGLAEGRAEAFFTLDTGKDQMTEKSRPAALVLVVRYRSEELRRPVATCKAPSLGSALGGGTERELEVALCDGEFWLVAEPGRVLVMRMDSTPKTVVEVALPWPNVRAVKPKER
jgi:hypothetical protein